jgi:hypothetical protein
MRCEVNRQLDQKRVVPPHSVKIPAQAEGVEYSLKPLVPPRPIHRKLTQIPLRAERPVDDTPLVPEAVHVPEVLDPVPLPPQCVVERHRSLHLVEFCGRPHHPLVSPQPDIVLVLRNGGAHFIAGRGRKDFHQEAHLLAQRLTGGNPVHASVEYLLDIEWPKRQGNEHPLVKRRHRMHCALALLPTDFMVAPDPRSTRFQPVIRQRGEALEVFSKRGLHPVIPYQCALPRQQLTAMIALDALQ